MYIFRVAVDHRLEELLASFAINHLLLPLFLSVEILLSGLDVFPYPFEVRILNRLIVLGSFVQLRFKGALLVLDDFGVLLFLGLALLMVVVELVESVSIQTLQMLFSGLKDLLRSKWGILCKQP